MTVAIRRFTLLALVGALTALALPGAASASGKGCRDGAYCLWTKTGYRGEKLVVDTNTVFNFPQFMNNKSSSFKNRVGNDDAVFLHIGRNGHGPNRCYDDGANDSQLGKGSHVFSSGDVVDQFCL